MKDGWGTRITFVTALKCYNTKFTPQMRHFWLTYGHLHILPFIYTEPEDNVETKGMHW